MRISLVEPLPTSLGDVPGGTVVATCDDGVLALDEARRPFRVDHRAIVALDPVETKLLLADAFAEAGEKIWGGDYVNRASEAFDVNKRGLMTDRVIRGGVPPALLRAVGDIARRQDAAAFGVALTAAARLTYDMGHSACSLGPFFAEAIDRYFSQLNTDEAPRDQADTNAVRETGEPVGWVSLVEPLPGGRSLPAGLFAVGTCDDGVLAYDRHRNPYRVDGQGETPLDAAGVKQAVAEALEEAGLVVWPQGYTYILSVVSGISRRSLAYERMARNGLPPKVIGFVADMARQTDARALGCAVAGVAIARCKAGSIGPEALRELVDDALGMHRRWIASRPQPSVRFAGGEGPVVPDLKHSDSAMDAEDDLAPRM